MRSVLLFLVNIGIALAEIILAPSNTVVMEGEELQMNCLVNNNSRVRKWDLFTTNIEQPIIYPAKQLDPRFTHFGAMVDDSGSGYIYANSTNLSDAGIYTCFTVIDGRDKQHSAQLTVLESMPICWENLTLNSSRSLSSGGYIWMQCTVGFRGFWTPTIEWIEYGGHLGPSGRIITEGVEVTRTPNKSISSNLTTVVNQSRSGSRFSCKIYFTKYDGIYNMTASNVPDFTYTWNSTPISLSSSESTPTATDTVESSTVTHITSEHVDTQTTSTDWYFISLSLVAALSLFFVVIVILVVVFCIRFKKKVSARYASVVLQKLEKPTPAGDYEILPYATSDNYDTIDDTAIETNLTVSFAPSHGPLPTPGYSGLKQMEPTAPGVYSRIDTNETPVDITSGSIDTEALATMGTKWEEQVDESETKKDGESVIHPYIELIDVVEADNTGDSKRTSDFDIPSSYLTVNF